MNGLARYEDVREGIATVLGSGEGFSGGTDYDSTGEYYLFINLLIN